MIQKLIINQEIKKRNIVKNEYKMNKELSLFLLKKSLFLYKSYYKRKAPRLQKNYKKIPPSLLQHNSNLFRQLVNRIRTKNKLIRDYAHRKYWFYRIKRNFWKINKFNRVFFFKQLGLKISKRAKSEFFLIIKNINKIQLFTDIRKYKLARVSNPITGVLPMIKNNPNMLFYFKKQKRISYAISKELLRRILSCIDKYCCGDKTSTYRKATDSYKWNSPQFYDPRQLIFINYCESSTIETAGFDLKHFNLFTIRSYNWKIIT